MSFVRQCGQIWVRIAMTVSLEMRFAEVGTRFALNLSHRVATVSRCAYSSRNLHEKDAFDVGVPANDDREQNPYGIGVGPIKASARRYSA